jgi:Protein of unknown function (DUF2778)
MFAGMRPDPSWRQALPPPDDRAPVARGDERLGAKAKGITSGDDPSLTLKIVIASILGLAALASVGFIGTVMLRLAAGPETVASISPPGPAIPSLTVAASNSSSQTSEPERLPIAEAPPIQFGVPQQASLEAAPPPASTTVLAPPPLLPDTTAPDVLAPLPPPRPHPLELGPPVRPATGYDQWTAIYDITAHAVYLPDGTRLEAHSGLGDRLDDPRFVDERDRGATPPHLYELTLRESLFHGVQALRLTPIGEGFSFDRVGLLAHPYMLGPNGDSNGCVSFKNYDAFLHAFQSGEIKRLAVVARLTQEPPQLGRLASLRLGLDH